MRGPVSAAARAFSFCPVPGTVIQTGAQRTDGAEELMDRQERNAALAEALDEEGAIRAAIVGHTGQAIRDRVDAFAALRRWKDGFTA